MTTTPPPPPPAVDEQARVEQLRKRGLFSYHDGFRPRMADLIEVQLRIANVLPEQNMAELDYLLEVAAGNDVERKPTPWDQSPTKLSVPAALVRLGQIVATGFDLPPLDEETGQGLSVQERVDLLADFLGTSPDEDEDEPAQDEEEPTSDENEDVAAASEATNETSPTPLATALATST